MEEIFTDNYSSDTLDLGYNLVEEEEMQVKFHNEYCIYLYCTLERGVTQNIINNNIYKVPLTLYETPTISKAMAVNIQDPVTLRIAVNLRVDKNEYCYDQLTMQDAIIKEKFKLKNIEQYKAKCVYTRCLVVEPKTKLKVIEYKINQVNKLLINPQYAD